jgi:hypothetical protein
MASETIQLKRGRTLGIRRPDFLKRGLTPNRDKAMGGSLVKIPQILPGRNLIGGRSINPGSHK